MISILNIADIIIGISLLALFTSIIINFVEANHQNKKVQKEKHSIVETGSMTLFFLGFYILLRFQIGAISLTEIFNTTTINTITIIGALIISTACTINIIARFNLGKNWGNQIKIYKSHKLTTTGMFKIVRHPLYSSIILMFYGACLVHPNYLAFIANTIIFIPFMYYRAKQEEELLIKKFKEYKQYKKEVGLFFPKIMKTK